MDKQSMTLGMLIGRQIAGLRSARKEPVAYLYNGVRLPAIPSEIAAYLYVVIQYSSPGTSYVFGFSQKPTTYETVWNLTEKVVVTGVPEGVEFGMAYKSSSGDKWNVHSNPGPHESRLDKTLWANYDVLDLDGSVYIAASEPIPFYE